MHLQQQQHEQHRMMLTNLDLMSSAVRLSRSEFLRLKFADISPMIARDRCMIVFMLVVVVLVCQLALVTSYAFPDCVNGPLAKFPVCDPSLGYHERAVDLISRFTVQDKLANLGNGAPGVSRLGLPAYQWWSEALHGIADSPGVNFARSGDYSSASSFPMPIGLGAAFDDPLIYAMGNVIGTEARAFNNDNRAGLDFWTPNINPYRDPRWGRGPETPGEDPFHLQSYVYNLITGLEGGVDPRYKKIVADCKHYAAYDMEDSDGQARYGFNAIVSLQDLVEYYLPPFESCIRDAKVGSIMCSYNAVNGIPSCANSWLLQTIAREHWGLDRYDGWVTSDCDAIGNIFDNHHYTRTPEEAVAAALLAGTDIDCGSYYNEHLPAALNQSLIREADLDRSLIRQYSSLIQLGYFDPASTQPYRKLSWADVNTPAAENLALTAARESITLLKNDGILPFASTKNVALIGPWGQATGQMQGNYFGQAPYLISPFEAFQNAKIAVTFVQGCTISRNDTSGFDAAVRAAQAADIIVFAGGPDNSVESEGHDRTTIVWPGVQLQLIQALEKAGKPVIVVQLGGGQVDDSYLKSSSTINAIVWAGYPGQSGGPAIVDVLTGIYAPAGRLPVTQYPGEYVNQVQMIDMTLRPSANNPGRTYKWYTGTTVYPFGYGLHYTTFSFNWASIGAHSLDIDKLLMNVKEKYGDNLDKAPLIDYAVNVTNIGRVTSDVVILLFSNTTSSHPNAPPLAPLRELVAYDRAHLIQPGQTQTVYFTLTLRSLSRVDDNGDRWLFPGTYRVFVDIDAAIEHTLVLTGEPALLIKLPASPTSSSSHRGRKVATN